MFEGLVRQLLLGYLGRYIKDIQKEQLKITLWNEEVLLENVELILEAFDYLQLPFALKQGRVGRLSIKIPWKKLGWDPIIIILEDVFIRVSQRGDDEWSLDAVERREFAGKKAKLAAAELAKLSRRVCDSQTGQSFISYVTAKILDSIHVSIRNFHVQYCDLQSNSALVMFGLRFSSLTVSKQNPIGSFGGRMRGVQVNKIVEIKALEIYCGMFEGADLTSFDYAAGNHLLQFDVSMSLLVNRSGKLDNDFPQYSISAEINNLVMSLNEVQLQQILILSDYLCTSHLREKYGRYRTLGSPLSRKLDGWPKMWWHYAQASVLSDVRKKLKKTSWRYLGQRLSDRRKYVNLYKKKLEFLQREQSVDESILRELEQMEKESDIDDILSYRSIAECELQEVLSDSSGSDIGGNASNNFVEKSRNDERSSGRSRGWLNWLSRGMLGAGGTDDSSQFSGVVSDEVVKDIYEATKFNPSVLSSGDVDAKDMIYTCAIKFHISQISASLWSMKSGQEIARLILVGAVVECKLWEELATITAFVKSVELLHPCNGKAILRIRGSFTEENVLEDEQTSCSFQMDVSPNQEVESYVKVMLQSPEVVYDAEFFLNLGEFFSILESFPFQHQRGLVSLNGIEDVRARLLAKTEYILSSRKKVVWDFRIIGVGINIPWRNAISDQCSMVLEMGSLDFTSKCDLESLASNIEEQSYLLNYFSPSDFLMGFRLQDLYNHFEVKLNNFEMKLMTPCYPETISILEKFCASILLASCIIQDESILKQLEVCVIMNTLHAHLSPTIYEAVVSLISHLGNLNSRPESVILRHPDPHDIRPNQLAASAFGCSIVANLESFTFYVDLANDGGNSSILMLAAKELDVRYSIMGFEECWICLKALEIIAHPLKGEKESHILFSSSTVHLQDLGIGHNDQSYSCNDRNNGGSSSAEACFLLHYEAHKIADSVDQNYTIFLNDADLHCHPYIFGLLNGFIDRISSYNSFWAGANSFSPISEARSMKRLPGFGFHRFGFSNFFESGYSDYANISLDRYPFVTIYNSGSLGTLESSLCYPISEWRKLFSLRDGKLRSPKFSIMKGSKYVLGSPLKSTSGIDALPMSGSFSDINQFVVHVNLCGIRVHFHDSSCIVGTVTLPTAKTSLAFSEDGMDMLCSTEGLILTTSWWCKNFNEFLWGPLLPNLSPILNIRIRRGIFESLSSQLEVSIGIQHVCCVLPPEYLSIIIGYFSLPDWHSNSTEKPVAKNGEHVDTENIIYKFEVLDSNLILPVESNDYQFLKIEIHQLYCSFIDESAANNVLEDIPPALVPEVKVAEKSQCLNLFGRDLFLSFLLFKDDGYGCLTLDQDIAGGSITLIAPLSADVWVRIPCKNESSSYVTCIMSRIGICQLSADDGYRLDGFLALLDVINQFSLVDVQSKSFTSDVLQFLQFNKGQVEGAISPVASGKVFTEVRCCVDSLLIKLHDSRKDLVLSEVVAKTEMQFTCSASLMDEAPKFLDFKFSSLTLYSLLHSAMLAQCTVTCSSSPALDICLSTSVKGENELCFSLLSLDVWLHSFAWCEVIDLFSACALKLTKTLHVGSSLSGSVMKTNDQFEHAAASIFKSSVPNLSVLPSYKFDNMKLDNIFIVRSENIGISIHIPFLVNGKSFSTVEVAEVQENMPQYVSPNCVEGKHCKFITVTAHSRSSELFIGGKTVKLKSILEKTSGTAGVGEDTTVNNWPFFQMTQVKFDTEIWHNQMELVHLNMGIQWDRLDVWLSHQLFCFLHDVQFNISDASSAPFNLASMDFEIQLRKISLLISDGRWSCSGPLMEILMRNIHLQANATEDSMNSGLTCDLQVNYNNIQKMSWEPFVEPWKFEINIMRKLETSALLNSSIITDINLTSAAQLNLNFTQSLFESVFRTIEMIKDAWGLLGSDDLPENQRFLNSQFTEDMHGGRYAPYILQNLTSLPLIYNVYQGLVNSDEFDISEMKDGKSVQPGASVPIYLNDTSDQQLFRYRAAHSSDRLSDKQSNGVSHHFMTIQLDGTSVSSAPISMDLVGLTYFEVDFSNTSNNIEVVDAGDSSDDVKNFKESNRADAHSGFVVPVVFDVSMQRYSKLIRLYSTVIILNATSIPLELRFDIPFGLSPKILDPVHPGQEFPLPLHLAEAGRMRWRPLGNSYLWSEVHNLPDILSHESKIGFLRSFVCYPSHPSSDPFRCCISVENISLPPSGRSKKDSSCHMKSTSRQLDGSCGKKWHDLVHLKKRVIHRVTLSTPLVVNNFLPNTVSLTVESGGITRAALLSEVETSFHHVDPSHDLGLEFHMHGFRPSVLKFPRTETFSTIAKFTGTKFSLSETKIFYPDLCNGPVYVTVEKMMDAFSGAREIFIFVPFLLYNCTGFPLVILDSASETKDVICTIPSCYELDEQELLQGEKAGLGLLSPDQDSSARGPQIDASGTYSSKNHIVSNWKHVNSHLGRFVSKSFHDQSSQLKSSLCTGSQLNLRDTHFLDNELGKAKACIYSPHPISSANELMVRVSGGPPRCLTEKMLESLWSAPFLLVPPSGSSTVLVPWSSTTAAYIMSVTSCTLAGPFAGRTQAITFQPRFVISNACSKDLCYRQKGTDAVFHLGVGQHSHLHWTDTTRELLVSVRFNEPGWQWSGSFLPDHLGDTQVKMRNYVSGGLSMIRVEVQNADFSTRDEKIVESPHGNSGTNLILLSDDDTGYMPYRIDNFSTERIRIYQQKCETFDTIVHPYTSSPYAWDEPCFPHRLTVEVPGERVVGSYALDDLKEFVPVHLQSTSEKPERKLLLSVRAEGATKVLNIIDSNYHILKDGNNQGAPRFRGRNKQDLKDENVVKYKEKFSLTIPYIGISLINSQPQELLFACAKNVKVDLLQSLDLQKLSFQVSSLQIDNQLQTTPYPVVLSFNHEYRSFPSGQKSKEDGTKSKSERLSQITSDNCYDHVFHLAVAKWRKKDISLASFEYISLRVADFCLELEQQLILSLLDFFKSVSPSVQSQGLPFSDPTQSPLIYDMGFMRQSSLHGPTYEYVKASADDLHKMNFPAFNRIHTIKTSLPSIAPIGAPWQQIYLLARRQKKIYIESFDLAPIKFTLSFSSAPWMLRNGVIMSGESLIHRGIMALADVEGAQIYLKELTIAHHMASWESIQEILIRHYTWQVLHEMYKVFGSAGVIGNPMGFARSVGLGIRDFLSVPARSALKSPTSLITGMAQGTSSLVSNTVYALSDAATQFSKAAHKGIVAFTFDGNAANDPASQSKGVINEVFEGLTGLLQSPVKGAEKHGLLGVLSGIALGVTGLVARPAASILEVTGKTAQSIRNRSRLYRMGSQSYRVRLPRPLSRELPLRPYSWEEAIGASLLLEADDGKFKDEVLVACKALKQAGKFVVITERLVLLASCSSLVDYGKPEFRGVSIDAEWVIESEIGLDGVIHADCDDFVVHIVGSSSDALLKQSQHQLRKGSGMRTKRWNNTSSPLPLFQTTLELVSNEVAMELLQILLMTIEEGKGRGWGCGHLLHQSNMK